MNKNESEKYVIRTSGLPFGPLLKRNLDRIEERVFTLNKAGMIIIDGGVGSGKTTLATHVADYLNKGPINFTEQLAMGGDDFQEKLRDCYQNRRRVIVYDEAGDFNRRSSLTRFNADLNRIFETYRVFKIIVVLVLPCVEDLDDSIFKKEIPRFLLHCYARTLKSGRYMGFCLNRIQWIKAYMKTSPVKTTAYFSEQHNIRERFLDLEPVRQKLLTDHTVAGKIEILETRLKKSTASLTIQDLSKLTGISYIAIQKRLNTIGEHGVASKNKGRKRFYPHTVIPLLQSDR